MIRYVLIPGRANARMDGIRARLSAPLSPPCGPVVVDSVMRRGPGSVEDQFGRSATALRSGGWWRWPPVIQFGSRAPGPSPLVQTGAYRAAWLGGSGGVSRVSAKSVAVGVSLRRFPGASAHQKDPGATTRIRAKRMSRDGKTTAMRLYLGLTFGVWISDRKLLGEGLSVPARPVRIGRVMIERAAEFMRRYLLTGRVA